MARGLSHMPWGRFVFYNAVGGILWATTIGLVAYYFGNAAIDAVEKYGLIAVGRNRGACGPCLFRTPVVQASNGET